MSNPRLQFYQELAECDTEVRVFIGALFDRHADDWETHLPMDHETIKCLSAKQQLIKCRAPKLMPDFMSAFREMAIQCIIMYLSGASKQLDWAGASQAMLERESFHCRNDGCTEQLTLKTIESHVCQFSVIKCPSCDLESTRRELESTHKGSKDCADRVQAQKKRFADKIQALETQLTKRKRSDQDEEEFILDEIKGEARGRSPEQSQAKEKATTRTRIRQR